MKFAVLLTPENGHFTAALVGAPEVRVTGGSRELALNALSEQISRRVADGELTTLEVPVGNLSRVAGRFADDPTLEDICDDAYRARNADTE